MKMTVAILSLAVLHCTVLGASIGNVDELKPLVNDVTSKISSLLNKLESEKELTDITLIGEDIMNAAEIVISKTTDIPENENSENDVDEDSVENIDIMRFIAENALDADEVVKVLFAEDQLEEDDWRVVLLLRSLSYSGEGLKFDFNRFVSASNDGDKVLELNNVRVWCQAIVKISRALVSAVDDAEMTLTTRMSIFNDQVPSGGKGAPELPPAGKVESPDKHQRQRRSWFSQGSWNVGFNGVTWSRGRHTFNASPTFSGFRPTGVNFRYTFSF